MKIIKTKVYTFDELSDKAKDKARQWYVEAFSYDEWWEDIYYDAKQVGIKITAFDIDRGSHCDIEFINDGKDVAESIIKNHGDKCDTYKTSKEYLSDIKNIKKREKFDGDGESMNAYEIENEIKIRTREYRRELSEDYLSILRQDYEYQTSNDSVDETIRINEYTFTEDGKRFG